MNRLEIRPVRWAGRWALLALSLAVVGCASTAPVPTPIPTPIPPRPNVVIPTAGSPPSVQVAFSGGGWRAHTAASGWVLTLLESEHHRLADVFRNVDTVASNSGGSWFSTMLVYSDRFVDAIEAPDALHTWADPGARGWLGGQRYLFALPACEPFGDAFLPCVFAWYTDSLDGFLYWHRVVENLAFRDFPITGLLSGPRQAWADDKALLLAATMLTNEAVLGENDAFDEQYYQACLSPSEPVFRGKLGARCRSAEGGAAPAESADVTPVTFASLPVGSPWVAPPWFSALGGGEDDQTFHLGYSEDAWWRPARRRTHIGNPPATDVVPVTTAAAASSAALGFLASARVMAEEAPDDPWWPAYEASDEALSFQLSGGLRHVLANGISTGALADRQIVQVADGGPVDNSGVAQVVRYLQSNGRGNGFEIVAFDNVRAVYSPGGASPDIGSNLANLFGRSLCPGDRFCATSTCDELCVRVPDRQIFDVAALTDPPVVTWSAQDGGNDGHRLIYTKYPVTTRDNPIFGVTGDTAGTLHAFTCVWSDAQTAPGNDTTDFEAYAAMLDFINTGLGQSGPDGTTGLEHLRSALGLSP